MKKNQIIYLVVGVVLVIFAILMLKPAATPEQIKAKQERDTARAEQRLQEDRLKAEVEAAKPESVRVQERKNEQVQDIGSMALQGFLYYQLFKK